MPLSPQIVITPEDITYKSFAISAVSYTSSTATYTATGHTFSAGNIVIITGLAPDGYNGTYTITSVATNTFTVSNSTNTALTDQSGNAYWADPTDYEYDGGQGVVIVTNNLDIADPTVNPAITTAAQAYADAQTALTNANTAITNANTALSQATVAYNAAVASLQPSAYTIVNASNQITAIAANGITIYSGASATSGARVVMNSVGIAGFDTSGNATFSITASTGAAVFKGSVTASTITASELNIGGKFYVNPTTGFLQTTDAVFAGTITSSSAVITGTLTINSIVATGTIYGTSGYLGNSSSGWTFDSAGQMYNNASAGSATTFLIPSSGTNANYALITDRGISAAGTTNLTTSNLTYTTLVGTVNIVGGYGITSDWSPNTDNTYTCGMSGRKWKSIWSNTGTIQTSDSRLKTNIENSRLGLDFVNSLRPVSYKWVEGEKAIVKDKDGNPVVIETDKSGKPVYQTESIAGKRTHWGFISQEVKDAVDKAGVEDFAGWVLDDVTDPNSTQGLRYEQFIAPIIKSIQELSIRITAIEGAN